MHATAIPAQLMSLPDAVLKATGQRPALSTIIRWSTRGINGVRLRTWRVGNRRLTTLDAVVEFVQTTTAADSGEEWKPTSMVDDADQAAEELARELAS